jgi:DNA-binding GntR family transcriptional regulator
MAQNSMNTRKSVREPRYRQLANELIDSIRSGKLPVGEVMPGELELVETHGVSRHTVRESLRVLEELGLIGRYQGVGTVVKSRDSAPAYVQTVNSPAELLQYPAQRPGAGAPAGMQHGNGMGANRCGSTP